jgi:DNA adenine methylase
MALPAIQLPGSKVRLAKRIIDLLGKTHGSYVEPYLGSAAVLLAKYPVKVELVNDIDHELVHFYKVLRARGTRYDLIDALVGTPYARRELEIANGLHDEPGLILDEVERARRFMVRTDQIYVGGGGTTQWVSTLNPTSNHSNATKWNNYRTRLSLISDRLQNVQIECIDGLRVLDKIMAVGGTGIATYLDPPYPTGTRSGSSYRAEMTNEQHQAMLGRAITLPGPTVISTYPNNLYDEVLTGAGWTCHNVAVLASSSPGKGSVASRTEVLWANSACVAAALPEGLWQS